MIDEQGIGQTHWPLRIWVLALLGAALAVAIDRLDTLAPSNVEWARQIRAASLFLGVGGLAFGLAWVRGRLAGGIVIALTCGLIAGAVLLWNNAPADFGGDGGWRQLCGLAAASVLLVLFQAGQDRAGGRPDGWSPTALRAWKRRIIHYPDVHDHLWTNALMIGAGCLFAVIALGLAHLLAEMFALVKIGILRRLLREGWFNAALCGLAFGAALGVLRDRGAIIGALRRVATVILRVLVPVFAFGIFVFLVALPVTGLAPLWETGGTTPLMLGGAIICLFLANAVVDDSEADESRSQLLSACAAALGLFLVPLVGIAAFSSGLRVAQHGLTPERLWALAFIIVGGIVAVAYAVTILIRRGWFVRLRQTNLRLLFLIAFIALLLSTPLLSFERIAAADQVRRLAGGQVPADAFDYKALWFDFGPSGRAAVRALATGSPDAGVRRYAAAVQKLRTRSEDAPNPRAGEQGAPLDQRLTIVPAPVPLDGALRARLVEYGACGPAGQCLLRYVPGESVALLVAYPAPACERCRPVVRMLTRGKGDWRGADQLIADGAAAEAATRALRAGQVAFRDVTRRQLYLGNEAMGDPIPPENAASAP